MHKYASIHFGDLLLGSEFGAPLTEKAVPRGWEEMTQGAVRLGAFGAGAASFGSRATYPAFFVLVVFEDAGEGLFK